jgi:hypothetical protein
MRIAIHQPNFCPTKGYFDKIAAVDLFVIMIHCQWEKGKYQNRFHVGKEWNTMSVNHGLEPIKDKVYLNPEDDWEKILNRYPVLNNFEKCISKSLCVTNFSIINTATGIMDISTPLRIDYQTELTGTERLVDICKHYGATEYLSGQSGRKYLDLKQFDEAGIKVSFQDNPDLTPLVHLL